MRIEDSKNSHKIYFVEEEGKKFQTSQRRFQYLIEYLKNTSLNFSQVTI